MSDATHSSRQAGPAGPTGVRPFAARCPLAGDVCRTERPPLAAGVACHHAGEAAALRLMAGVGQARSLSDSFSISSGVTMQQFPGGFLRGVASAGHRETFARTPKPGAGVYAALVKEQRRG